MIYHKETEYVDDDNYADGGGDGGACAVTTSKDVQTISNQCSKKDVILSCELLF